MLEAGDDGQVLVADAPRARPKLSADGTLDPGQKAQEGGFEGSGDVEGHYFQVPIGVREIGAQARPRAPDLAA